MRVVGGKLKGRRLKSFKGRAIRPTSDMVREAVFSILGSVEGFEFNGTKALDLFAGTGAMGIEAISRGAESAVFIDNSKESTALISKNLEACGIEGSAAIVKKDALSAISHFSKHGEKFDMVFIDPPYGGTLLADALNAITVAGILNHKAVLVAETSKRTALKDAPSGLQTLVEKKYGDTLIYIFSIL
ncbi:MAG: 16S rRNA (guanine(966)-N(2))-methyltransferase RsmD [Deltaproteobacteria bacterium]|nr:16S rRNA (guanine(966)-N(2))-methyltransferase RsmD [Deltaproteobacteria bacterium]